MARPDGSGPLSHSMCLELKKFYEDTILHFSNNPSNLFRCGLNVYTTRAVLIAPLAVNVWEARLNELFYFFSTFSPDLSNSKELLGLIEKSEIKTKTIIIPQLMYGESFDKGAQPFQDFARLVEIRNSIVHFKQNDYPKKTIQYLEDKNKCLKCYSDSYISWPMMLHSTEFMRWAINTVCRLILKMDTFRNGPPYGNYWVFEPISEADAIEIFAKYNIDHQYISPEYC